MPAERDAVRPVALAALDMTVDKAALLIFRKGGDNSSVGYRAGRRDAPCGIGQSGSPPDRPSAPVPLAAAKVAYLAAAHWRDPQLGAVNLQDPQFAQLLDKHNVQVST